MSLNHHQPHWDVWCCSGSGSPPLWGIAFFSVPVYVADKLGAEVSHRNQNLPVEPTSAASMKAAVSRCDLELLIEEAWGWYVWADVQAKELLFFPFLFHATDQTRAEIDRNSFPAHFICETLMDLEVNISVHGTDRETDTSRTTLDDHNPEILQIAAIWILY